MSNIFLEDFGHLLQPMSPAPNTATVIRSEAERARRKAKGDEDDADRLELIASQALRLAANCRSNAAQYRGLADELDCAAGGMEVSHAA